MEIDDRIPGLIFGALLLLIGGTMLTLQLRAAKQLSDPDLSDRDRKFLGTRNRRRMQVAGMIILIGLMIPVGDSIINWREHPATFGIFCLIILVLACWTGLLAVSDMVSTRLYASAQLNRYERQCAELEKAANQLKAQRDQQSRD